MSIGQRLGGVGRGGVVGCSTVQQSVLYSTVHEYSYPTCPQTTTWTVINMDRGLVSRSSNVLMGISWPWMTKSNGMIRILIASTHSCVRVHDSWPQHCRAAPQTLPYRICNKQCVMQQN